MFENILLNNYSTRQEIQILDERFYREYKFRTVQKRLPRPGLNHIEIYMEHLEKCIYSEAQRFHLGTIIKLSIHESVYSPLFES